MGGKSILKNILNLSAAEFGSRLINFFTFAYLARVLTVEGFGLLNFANAFIAYFLIVVNFGLDTVGTKLIAENRSVKSKVLINILSFRIIISVLMFFVLWATILFLEFDELKNSIIILSGLAIISGAFTTRWFFQAIENLKLTAVVQILSSIFNLAAVLLFIHTIENIQTAVIISVSVQFISYMFLLSYISRKVCKIKLSLDFAYLIEIIKSALPLLISLFMISIYYNMDHVMLGFLSTEKEVGIYSASYKILLLGLIPASIIINSFFPKLAEHSRNRQKLTVLMDKYSSLMFLGGFLISSSVYIFSDVIINSVFGENFEKSIFLLQILSFNILIIFVNVVYGNPLLAWGKNNQYLIAITLGAISNVILNFILIPKYLSVGAAIATINSEIIVFIGVIIIHKKFTAEIFSNKLLKLFIVVGILVTANILFLSQIDLLILRVSVYSILAFVLLYVFRFASYSELKGFFTHEM